VSDQIVERLHLLEGYVAQLDRLRKIPSRTLDEQRSLERHLQLAAECVLDIGEIIIAERGLTRAGTYREVIQRLAEGGVIPGEFAHDFEAIAGLRNVLVHDYADLDPAQLDRDLARLEDFRTFARHVAAFRAKHPRRP
jgi:uncharacterized protein YutE (UPF0331/DUF86 family)